MAVNKETGEEEIVKRARHPFSRLRVVTKTKGICRTKQSHADACDVNKIIERYDHSGRLPPGMGEGSYADVTGLQGDLTELYQKSAGDIAIADDFLAAAAQSADEEESNKEVDPKQLDIVKEIEKINARFDALPGATAPSNQTSAE